MGKLNILKKIKAKQRLREVKREVKAAQQWDIATRETLVACNILQL